MSKTINDLSLSCKRQCGYVKELEAEKAELIDFIRYMYYNVGLDEDEEKKFDTILQKYGGNI